ncbi:PIN domain-containing protein [Thermosinus carboxydivorans]|nr:PIN domain-containing protein [Thermosinus carboxydivorans]
MNIIDANVIDWSDAFTASQMINRGIAEIYSFDKHFDRIANITRVEP